MRKSRSQLSAQELGKLWRDSPLCRRASEAYKALVKQGCEPQLIDAYLRRIVGYKDLSYVPVFLRGAKLYQINRQWRELLRQIRKITGRLEELMRVPVVWERLSRSGCASAPSELSRIADRLSQASKTRTSRSNPHREAILDLLDLIRRATGRYHYSEAADLINAAYYWRALRRGEDARDLSYDVDSLKAMARRQKRRTAAKPARRRLSARKLQLRPPSTSGPRSLPPLDE